MANTSNGMGVSTFGLLGIVFVVLKLTDYIDWSWWWVLLPFYGGLVILAFFALIGYLIIKNYK